MPLACVVPKASFAFILISPFNTSYLCNASGMLPSFGYDANCSHFASFQYYLALINQSLASATRIPANDMFAL
jgi:hypothetical protein